MTVFNQQERARHHTTASMGKVNVRTQGLERPPWVVIFTMMKLLDGVARR